jgi:hypothetical protein
VKNDAERHSVAASDDTDTVPRLRSMIAAHTLPRPFAYREYRARAA